MDDGAVQVQVHRRLLYMGRACHFQGYDLPYLWALVP